MTPRCHLRHNRPVSTELIVWILTGLAAVVVVLTRLRLRREGGAGRTQVGAGVLALHTVAGLLALAVWIYYLLPGDSAPVGDSVTGIVAVGLWWLVAAAGLMMLTRWLPSRGRHSGDGAEDGWSEGPGLSLLAHVGMLVGVGVFTWAYLFDKV